jgi:hypothetical protein
MNPGHAACYHQVPGSAQQEASAHDEGFAIGEGTVNQTHAHPVAEATALHRACQACFLTASHNHCPSSTWLDLLIGVAAQWFSPLQSHTHGQKLLHDCIGHPVNKCQVAIRQ